MAINLDLSEAYEILRQDIIENTESIEEIIIRASKKGELTRNELLNTLFEKGVLAVYNLGAKHMYEYLKGKENERFN